MEVKKQRKEGKPVAIVTGSNKGIGIEIARGLGKQGFHVIITSTDFSRAETAAKELSKQSISCDPYVLDLEHDKSIDDFAKWFSQKYGTVDVLVHNAGYAVHGEGFDKKIASKTIGINYFGTLRLTELLHIEPTGRVVILASRAGKMLIAL